VYRYGRYRCSCHVTKEPAVCANGMSIRHDVLETTLLNKFQAALTPAMVDYLVSWANRAIAEFQGSQPQELDALISERRRIEVELSNLIDFVAKGEGAGW
jgi:hypothetical protein